MTIERDVRRLCYVIRIPREEIKEIVVQAYDETPSDIDECMSLVLAKRILQLINSDRRENL